MRVAILALVIGVFVPKSAGVTELHPAAFDPTSVTEVSVYRVEAFLEADVPFEYGPNFRRSMPTATAREYAEAFVRVHPDAVVEICPFQIQRQYLWSIPVTWKDREKRCERWGISLS